MPFTKQLAVNDPAAVFASTIIEQNEVVKAAEALIGPAKKELAALAEGYFYKDLPKVKAEVPSVYVVGATVTTSMPDGTLVVSPAGKDLQVQMKKIVEKYHPAEKKPADVSKPGESSTPAENKK